MNYSTKSKVGYVNPAAEIFQFPGYVINRKNISAIKNLSFLSFFRNMSASQEDKPRIPFSLPLSRRGYNLSGLIGWRALLPGLTAAAVSGLLLSAAFPPLEWAWLAWAAFLPILTVPFPRRPGPRLLIGFVLGYSHFATTLYWLNPVGFFAGYLMALICALYPMVWYYLITDIILLYSPVPKNRPDEERPLRPSLFNLNPFQFTLLTLAAPVFWVTLEWVRSWIFTGFPWNQLAVSQWHNLNLLEITTLFGTYGLSFLILLINLSIAWIFCYRWKYGWRRKSGHIIPWPLLASAILIIPALFYMYSRPNLPPADTEIRIAAIQGNIEQARIWSQAQLDEALKVYNDLSREAARDNPDLIVWPETAVPAPVFFNRDYLQMQKKLLSDIKTPLLFGSTHREKTTLETGEDEFQDFNAVFLIDENQEVKEYYYKIHLVPFGEYVPLGDIFPGLYDLIGMGRDLTAGREYTLFQLNDKVWAGVNICFEDVFPEISRNFVLRGANLMITLTNNAWFEETAGSRQHLSHAVFRAAENRLPLLRSGNNSDTALIMPNGEVRNLLYDNKNGDRFIRDWRTYRVPIWLEPETTFYTRHGNIFAWLCAGLTFLWLIRRALLSLKRNLSAKNKISHDE